jgi:hypothetical protein
MEPTNLGEVLQELAKLQVIQIDKGKILGNIRGDSLLHGGRVVGRRDGKRIGLAEPRCMSEPWRGKIGDRVLTSGTREEQSVAGIAPLH